MLGFPTIFNILGPLSNPAGVRRQVIGVRDQPTARTMANVLAQLGSERVLIVTSPEGADELTLTGPNCVVDYDRDRGTVEEYTVDARDYGLMHAELGAIRGGDAAENAAITTRVLDGEDSAYRQTVVLNAAAALVASGSVASFGDAIALAQDSIDSGAARQTVGAFVAFSNQPADGSSRVTTPIETGTILDRILARTAADLVERKARESVCRPRAARSWQCRCGDR